MSSIFGLRSSYMLEYRWLFALFLRSARCFTGAEGKWTLLPPISLPSSPLPRFSLFILVLLCWGHVYLQCLCLLDGFFPWVLWSDFLGLFLLTIFWSLFCLMCVLLSWLFFLVHLLWIFVSSPSLLVCVGVLFWGGSVIGSICLGDAFLST